MTLRASSTSKQSKRHKLGDVREDGYIFGQHRKEGDQWLSPEAYHRKRIGFCVARAKKRAKDNGLPFDIDTKYLLSIYPKDNKCPIFRTEMVWGNSDGLSNSPSLDRIYPALGYVKGNVIWISNYANRLKSDHSLDTLRTLLAFYEDLERRK